MKNILLINWTLGAKNSPRKRREGKGGIRGKQNFKMKQKHKFHFSFSPPPSPPCLGIPPKQL